MKLLFTFFFGIENNSTATEKVSLLKIANKTEILSEQSAIEQLAE